MKGVGPSFLSADLCWEGPNPEQKGTENSSTAPGGKWQSSLKGKGLKRGRHLTRVMASNGGTDEKTNALETRRTNITKANCETFFWPCISALPNSQTAKAVR